MPKIMLSLLFQIAALFFILLGMALLSAISSEVLSKNGQVWILYNIFTLVS